jgi:uncharacterized protein YbcC (UPF0753/DUF2309 family)
LEILSLVPTTFAQCSSCETIYDQAGVGAKVHTEIMQEYPPDLLQDHIQLSSWVEELARQYQADIQIRVIAPQSGLGFFKCLRHLVRRYPTFIITGKSKYTGWDQAALDALLQEALVG